MKIIALLPFKNEGWILKRYIRSMGKIADLIVAFDDDSTDDGKVLLEEAGARIITEDYKKESGWAEYEIRQKLLEEGRKAGGTHFICLDADEIFTDNFFPSARRIIGSLRPGQSLWMDWITLYGRPDKERIDGVFKGLNKSFIFSDRPDLAFAYAFLGVSRTPSEPSDRMVIDRKAGAVIHFQYLNLQRSLMKRSWYMCSELIKGERSALRINTTYDIRTNDRKVVTRDLDADSSFEPADDSSSAYEPPADWRSVEIFGWFDRYRIEFFEPLDIWSDERFEKEFERRVGRKPVPKRPSGWLIKMNDLKNKIKNL